ncbi:hypothetical protein [Winogradskya humida]|uniref:Uncharacterized protein n=1 Tax=Winogradskya humida TaxID=113566 RepID=A0ABQ4A748_9ACTN|nr:hypothetical protein [Actinoplanes humidus]GIE26673.1 hypothetical protein Ahu01nite_097750 [Actinoplanes humidus]
MNITQPYDWRTDAVLYEVADERARQDAKFGQQNHLDGTGQPTSRAMADSARTLCKDAAQRGLLTWRFVLEEEYREAVAERDPVRLRAELLQVAAVAVAWVEAIDRRPFADDKSSHDRVGS